MVFALSAVRHIEEKALICGHVLILLGNYDQAQAMLLSSSCPIEALNVRKVSFNQFWRVITTHLCCIERWDVTWCIGMRPWS